MRLKYIQKADFRKSERTNLVEFRKKNYAAVRNLLPDDVICFISSQQDQLVFVHGFVEMTNGKNQFFQILSSRRLRITGGTWNPLRLADYAKEVGLELEGLKKFADYYKNLK